MDRISRRGSRSRFIRSGDLDCLVEVRDNEIGFLKLAQGEQRVYTVLESCGPIAHGYDITLENRKTGAGVSITSNQPFAKLSFWSRPRVVGPEPYIHLRIESGDTVAWEIRYVFYTIP